MNKENKIKTDSIILRFFRDDIGGILITDENGNIIYDDGKTAFIRQDETRWKASCPPPREGQRGEVWDLMYTGEKAYMVVTSTYTEDSRMIQVHLLVDTSEYMNLYRDITQYSRTLKTEKERDGLTGLYNKGKFMEMKRSLFVRQETIAVFNMDVNNLKTMNDIHGHEAGDALLRKAAESLKKIEARNVIPFRTGGDEFIVVAIHVSREEAEQIRANWEKGLAELNRRNDGIPCVVACGLAYGDPGFDLEEVFATADRRMYEDKKEKKKNGPPGTQEIR